MDDQRALVARAKRDPSDFAPLYARYHPLVLAFCRRRLANPEAAEDATSLVFAKALAAIQSVHDDAFPSWLFTIARRVVVDTYRARPPAASLDGSMMAWMADRDPSPEALAIAAEERCRLADLITTLTPGQRAVIELRIAGLSGAEIADALGLSLAAVKIQQFRAVARLQTALRVTTPQEVHDVHG